MIKHFKGDENFSHVEDELKERLGHAIDEVEDKSYCELHIPEKLKRGETTVSERLIKMLDQQIADYKACICKM